MANSGNLWSIKVEPLGGEVGEVVGEPMKFWLGKQEPFEQISVLLSLGLFGALASHWDDRAYLRVTHEPPELPVSFSGIYPKQI